ncbi:MAG: HD family phosphohydrolase [Chitinophagaceae bacterium]|jgi:predicted metal-dependent HD superfamily phosphohydrolase|nr:HD family phosphohydrolase [Chitinophagaceae bacterium]
MTSQQQQILQEAKNFVTTYFEKKVNKSFVYHTIDHTNEVVKAAETIANEYDLNDDDHYALMLAVWFHDTGYSSGVPLGHEEKSQSIAEDFLSQHKVEDLIIEKIKGCILATKMPQTPTNDIERIICDSDLQHLGSPAFEEKNDLLRKEINSLQEDKIKKKEWRRNNIDFLRRHRFFTTYGQKVLEPIKQQHLKTLSEDLDKKERKKLEDPQPQRNVVTNMVADETASIKQAEKKVKTEAPKNDKLQERGVVAMFRIMSENHVNLSQMADSKANIMISVNTIVLSIMVSLLLGKLQFYPEFIIPTVILVVVCLSTVIFSILATRPNITGGTFTQEDVKDKKINLLFFGNFFRMDLFDYDWAMREMMNDKDYLYGNMIKDIYYLGIVLARKYKLLRISYNIFMFGLITAILSFGIAFMFSGQQ